MCECALAYILSGPNDLSEDMFIERLIQKLNDEPIEKNFKDSVSVVFYTRFQTDILKSLYD